MSSVTTRLLAALLFAVLVAATALALIVVENQRDRPPIARGTEAATSTGVDTAP